MSIGPQSSTQSPESLELNKSLGTSQRARMGILPGFAIAATGSYLPSRIVPNEELTQLGFDSEWIKQRTGILQRHWAGTDEASSDLAYHAAIDCLAKANVDPKDVDLIVLATITPDHMTPSTACHLQRRLNCIAPAMDLNAACSGFLYALVTAGQFVANGFARRALVVGSEIMSRTVDPKDLKTFPLFGDGAGAALLVPAPDKHPSGAPSGLQAFALGAEGNGTHLLCIHAGGSREPLHLGNISDGRQFMKMDGKAVFKWAVRAVVDSIHDVLDKADCDIQQVDQFILHQANARILSSAIESLGINPNKVFSHIDRVGNTSAASVPLALDHAISAGRIQRGHRILLCGFGSGLTWGTALMQY